MSIQLDEASLQFDPFIIQSEHNMKCRICDEEMECVICDSDFDSCASEAAGKNVYAVDHMGRQMSADEVCTALSMMLGWKTPVTWTVLETSLCETIKQSK